jgi:hypothetical protein
MPECMNRRDSTVLNQRFSKSPPESDSTKLNQTLALSFCLSMIFSENRFPLFRIML